MTSTRRFADGSYAKVGDNGSWILRLPDGTSPRGHEASPEAAIIQVVKTHTDYVLTCWEQGRHTAYGYLVPLREPQPRQEVLDELQKR